MASSSSPLVFSVKRHDPEFVRPTNPTPREVKQLSDIDDQEGLRFQVPVIMFYPNNPLMKGKDPVKVIREALGKALVYYYPFAGRLIEGHNRKLMVDCTGEGVLFIEADADSTLENLGDAIQPMCPCFEELLYDVPGSGGILGSPLILIQVTRLRCGGFIFALRLNHTMSDGPGLVQFLDAISEMAQGLSVPSLLPIWQRELLNARNPPRITRIHHEYQEVTNAKGTLMTMDENNLVHRSFFFGPKEIRALRNRLPASLGACSTFEVLIAYVWRCRTIAFAVDPDEVVRISCLINMRGKRGFDLPPGYYGNAFVYPASITKAGMLCKNPLEYAIRLLKKAKAEMSQEYVKSVADLMVIKGRPSFTQPGNYLISDLTRAGFGEIDFGWGKPVYGGIARALSNISFCMRFRNSKGEEGNVIPICLPPPVTERFEQELKRMTKEAEPVRLIKSML
ncbi:methanol O-anthraniloyltransferase [Vitis vinifera]|uniref:Methanol O-anthraniloyltransferase n=1 Tax=Vitis vinifera TaxID=29760 RepID=A0A438IAM7_VITVI|nr:methanol O-anthraniloyltransferase [Vitis vinifera]RVW93761.1 Methanol O-anthraniloyltransferase [Vitis vinifera]|eukprot:XP_002266114.1 PREDICTED: methanol O-anthraniloyltransferase [Vitis vinifera]